MCENKIWWRKRWEIDFGVIFLLVSTYPIRVNYFYEWHHERVYVAIVDRDVFLHKNLSNKTKLNPNKKKHTYLVYQHSYSFPNRRKKKQSILLN